jgi:hypothetical protein
MSYQVITVRSFLFELKMITVQSFFAFSENSSIMEGYYENKTGIMSACFSGDKSIFKNIEAVPNRRGVERRLHPRFYVNITTQLECGNILYKGTIVNISKKGCRVITDSPIHKATNQVALKFILPGESGTRNIKGMIKWTGRTENSFLIGIEFEKLQNF